MNTDHLFSVKDKIIVITGILGQLGITYTKALLDRGSFVVGLDIIPFEIGSYHFLKENHRFHFIETDITDKLALEEASKQIKTLFGIPHVLINNAALDSPPDAPEEENGPFEFYPESSWDNVMNVNVKGTFLCCQIFGKAMAGERRGSIINISSIYGLVSPDQNLYQYRRNRGETFYKPIAYSVSKSAIFNLTRYLAIYWAKKNVRVNTLTLAGVFNNQDEAFLNSYQERIPIGRMAESGEYCGAIIFLSSDASSYMTGSNLLIDGGWTAI